MSAVIFRKNVSAWAIAAGTAFAATALVIVSNLVPIYISRVATWTHTGNPETKGLSRTNQFVDGKYFAGILQTRDIPIPYLGIAEIWNTSPNFPTEVNARFRRVGFVRSSFKDAKISNINNIIFVDGMKYTTIQSALDALTMPDQKVFVRSGTYVMLEGLIWPAFPVNLECADKNSTILSFTITTGAAISPWYGSRIAHCSIRGPGKGAAIGINGGAAVWGASAAYNSAINNISPTIEYQNGHIYKETAVNCMSARIEPKWPTAAGGVVRDGSCIWREEGPTSIEIYDDIIEGFGRQLINSGGYSYGWSIHHNILRDGLNEAILVGGEFPSQKFAITDNTFENMVNSGVDLNGTRNLVANNTFYRIGGGGGAADVSCVLVYGQMGFAADDNKIRDNTCDHAAGPAFYVAAAAGATANRNRFTDNHCVSPAGTGSNGDCYTLDGSGGGGTMDQNGFIGNTGLNAQRFCINVTTQDSATITNTRVIGNTCSGSGNADFQMYKAKWTIARKNKFRSATPISITNHSR